MINISHQRDSDDSGQRGSLRLLYVLDNYWPHVGGAERAFKTLCEMLAARGHFVTVITLWHPGTATAEVIRGVRILRVKAAGNRYFFAALALKTCLSLARNTDVIHASTFSSAAVASLAGLFCRKPTVLTVFETWIGQWREYTTFPTWKAAVHDCAERVSYFFPFDVYVGISDFTSGRLRNVALKRPARITTIYFGFDPGPWTPNLLDETRQKQLNTGSLNIVGYGRPGLSKGFPYLLNAFAEIKRRVPAATLTLVLSTSKQYARELQQLRVRNLDGVTVLRSMDLRNLVNLVQSADCVVVPSLTEGFGYTTLEAAASGVPVVASNVASIPEVIGGRFLLVPPRDCSAIADAVVKVHQGICIEAPLREFPWTRTADSYESIYRDLTRT